MTTKPITLITNVNQSMGVEIATQLGQAGHHVILGVQDSQRGERLAVSLGKQGIQTSVVQLDATCRASINGAKAFIEMNYGYLTTLINNGGVSFDRQFSATTLSSFVMRQDFETNFFGMVDVTQAMLPLLKKGTSAQIINVTGRLAGVLQSKHIGAGYRASQAAANQYTIDLRQALKGSSITANFVNSDWLEQHISAGREVVVRDPTLRLVTKALQRGDRSTRRALPSGVRFDRAAEEAD